MPTENLVVRDLQPQDIRKIFNYWNSLTAEDCKRMSIVPERLPVQEEFGARMAKVLTTPIHERAADPLIWQVGGEFSGLTILNAFQRPDQADIHLHMVTAGNRRKGYGRILFMMSIKEYFKRHGLKKIICQPASTNPAPNKMMAALGIPIAKTYITQPSQLCFEHEVNRYEFFPA